MLDNFGINILKARFIKLTIISNFKTTYVNESAVIKEHISLDFHITVHAVFPNYFHKSILGFHQSCDQN